MTDVLTDVLRTIKNKIKGIYGDNYNSISYIVDWQVSEGPFLKTNSSDERWQDCCGGIIRSQSNHSG